MEGGRERGKRERGGREGKEREEEERGEEGGKWERMAGSKSMHIHKCTHEHLLGAMASISPGFPAELTSISLKLTSAS